VVGVTTNPTIFARAIGEGDHYNDRIQELAARWMDAEQALSLLTAADVRRACDVLRPTFDDSGGVDGRASIEVDPVLAYGTERTVAQARRLWSLVERPNLMVRIPATTPGLAAITRCLGEGISVDATLLFSRRRYRDVIDAYLDGLAAARAAGRDLTRIVSVASLSVSRVDAEVDRRLDAIGSVEAMKLRGRAAIANARLACRIQEEVFGTQRWRRLAEAGARPQRLLWASTGVTDPRYADTRYVVDLVTRGVVNTMSRATLAAVADHGVVRGDTVRPNYQDAADVMDRLAALGIDFDEVAEKLEHDGLDSVRRSWATLTRTLEQRLVAATRGEDGVRTPEAGRDA
jgi:transaldolase